MKTKVHAIAAAAALTAMLGLGACGGQAASSAASSTSESTSAAASTTSEAASTSAAASTSEAASSAATSAEDTHVSWQGALADGTMVDYISSEDGTHGGFVLIKADDSEPKRWLGAMTVAEDGTVSINSDQYGKGTLVEMTVGDWVMLESIATELGV